MRFCDRGKHPRAYLHHDPRGVSFFRLDFADPHHMRPGMAGKPAYLRLMMDAHGNVKIKPQICWSICRCALWLKIL